MVWFKELKGLVNTHYYEKSMIITHADGIHKDIIFVSKYGRKRRVNNIHPNHLKPFGDLLIEEEIQQLINNVKNGE